LYWNSAKVNVTSNYIRNNDANQSKTVTVAEYIVNSHIVQFYARWCCTLFSL